MMWIGLLVSLICGVASGEELKHLLKMETVPKYDRTTSCGLWDFECVLDGDKRQYDSGCVWWQWRCDNTPSEGTVS